MWGLGRRPRGWGLSVSSQGQEFGIPKHSHKCLVGDAVHLWPHYAQEAQAGLPRASLIGELWAQVRDSVSVYQVNMYRSNNETNWKGWGSESTQRWRLLRGTVKPADHKLQRGPESPNPIKGHISHINLCKLYACRTLGLEHFSGSLHSSEVWPAPSHRDGKGKHVGNQE